MTTVSSTSGYWRTGSFEMIHHSDQSHGASHASPALFVDGLGQGEGVGQAETHGRVATFDEYGVGERSGTVEQCSLDAPEWLEYIDVCRPAPPQAYC